MSRRPEEVGAVARELSSARSYLWSALAGEKEREGPSSHARWRGLARAGGEPVYIARLLVPRPLPLPSLSSVVVIPVC